MILKPLAPRPGDRVGVIAPAGPVKPEELDAGLDRLASFGLTPVPGAHLYDALAYTAGPDAARLEDLHDMFARPEIRAVFCARGGYGCLRLLSLIDFHLIESNPKLIMGFSDITSLLWGLQARTGLVSVHGPVVKTLTRDGGRAVELLFDWAREPGRPPEIDLSSDGRVLRPGRASGTVFGGNLSLVVHLMGTGFLPDLSGALLFLEETREPVYRIDRMLTHLAMNGVFDRIAGLLVGDFDGIGDVTASVPDLFMEKVGSAGIPVVAGLPVGHGERNLPLPIGLKATLDTERMRLTYRESCFSG